jgi:hypothetical protein
MWGTRLSGRPSTDFLVQGIACRDSNELALVLHVFMLNISVFILNRQTELKSTQGAAFRRYLNM